MLFIVSTLIITSSFYNNKWGLVNDEFHEYWRSVFDQFVMGRLVKSLQDGAFSAGGLLLIGDTDHYDVTSKTIRHQYDVYYRGQEFSSYWAYRSTPGLEGIIFSTIDKYTSFAPETNIRLFRIGTSILSAMIFALILAWIEIEFGIFSYLIVLASIVLSPWLALMGGSLYWQLWSLYLPFAITLTLNAYFSRGGTYSIRIMGIAVFAASLMKILFTGFEFITTTLVSLTIPFVYYSIRDRWVFDLLIKRLIHATGFALLGTFLGLVILIGQISFESGNLINGYQYVLEALGRRSIGNPVDHSGMIADALGANQWDVIMTYVTGPAYGLGSDFIGGTNVNSLSHLTVLILFFLFSMVLYYSIRRSEKIKMERKATALLATTWCSILAPLSWLILFKAHAYIHTNLDYFVWQLPFMILGFALVGYSVSFWFYPRNGKTSAD